MRNSNSRVEKARNYMVFVRLWKHTIKQGKVCEVHQHGTGRIKAKFDASQHAVNESLVSCIRISNAYLVLFNCPVVVQQQLTVSFHQLVNHI